MEGRCVLLNLMADPGFWIALFSVTLIQVALGADNLIIITILAGKLPEERRPRAIQIGLALAMVFRIVFLGLITLILDYAIEPFWRIDAACPLGIHVAAAFSGKSLVLMLGGVVLIWKGIKELRIKAKGAEHEVKQVDSFSQVVAIIVAMNLLFSVDSILTVVGMTDLFPVMLGSVVISVGVMLAFVRPISTFIARNPDFEILGLFVLMLIGFVLFLEGGHVAHIHVNDSAFPYIPQWIVIFILGLMFSIDLFQNWLDRKQDSAPVQLHHRQE